MPALTSAALGPMPFDVEAGARFAHLTFGEGCWYFAGERLRAGMAVAIGPADGKVYALVIAPDEPPPVRNPATALARVWALACSDTYRGTTAGSDILVALLGRPLDPHSPPPT